MLKLNGDWQREVGDAEAECWLAEVNAGRRTQVVEVFGGGGGEW